MKNILPYIEDRIIRFDAEEGSRSALDELKMIKMALAPRHPGLRRNVLNTLHMRLEYLEGIHSCSAQMDEENSALLRDWLHDINEESGQRLETILNLINEYDNCPLIGQSDIDHAMQRFMDNIIHLEDGEEIAIEDCRQIDRIKDDSGWHFSYAGIPVLYTCPEELDSLLFIQDAECEPGQLHYDEVIDCCACVVKVRHVKAPLISSNNDSPPGTSAPVIVFDFDSLRFYDHDTLDFFSQVGFSRIEQAIAGDSDAAEGLFAMP